MKRTTIFILLVSLLLTGCHHKNKEFTTHTVTGERCYLQIFDEPIIWDLDTLGAKITYSVVWPDEGLVSNAALRELQYLYFGDSTVSNIADAPDYWLNHEDIDSWFFYSDETVNILPVTTLEENRDYSYIELEGSFTQDDDLALFVVSQGFYPYGAAHGHHSVDFLTIDKATGNAIHLIDLVTDTNLLCQAIAHAIQELEVNSGVRECLFGEFADVDRMPLPKNFTIDSARNNIIIYYGLYEIAPYACGIQEIELPISWLSNQLSLTPFAKRLFGSAIK